MKEAEFEIVENAVSEIIKQTGAQITDIAFYYDPEEERYLIIHNFFDKIFGDDDFARKVSNVLYENLDQKGVEHYDFYSDDDMLAELTINYECMDSDASFESINFLIPTKEMYSVDIKFDEITLEIFNGSMLLSA